MLTFFVGSYTEWLLPDFGGTGEGIYTVQLDPQTGILNIVHKKAARNPSYLALSTDRQFLYAVTELDQKDHPKVQAYRIEEDASLTFLNEQAITGSYPCHMVAHDQQVFVAAYMTGNVLQFPTSASGNLLPCLNNFYHEGSSINQERQETAHAHQVSIHPNGKDVFVCDLGIDQLKAYELLGNSFSPNPAKDISVTPGGGPRHLVFNKTGSLVYVINELSGFVSILQNQEGSYLEIDRYAALPKDYSGPASGSAIRLHPNGQYVYAANRKAEAIAIFEIVNNQLKLLGHQYTSGVELREFNITPDGQHLIACHQNSHDTIVYRILDNGRLQERYRTQAIQSPVCVVF